jgi:anaerobic magnesium-protoporphyrin IX monomethyl ester cyclase
MDILFVEPNAAGTYQALANTYSAIETPTWNLLLAGAVRSHGLSTGILDANAERLAPAVSAQRILELNPKVVIISCYGQNPNSSTPFFGAGIEIAAILKKDYNGLIGFVGQHVAALPIDTLNNHPFIDFVLCNEGVKQIFSLFSENLNLTKVRGIAYRRSNMAFLNPPEEIVPQDQLESIYTGYAWDLLPFKNKPLDLYRSHLWHSDFGNLPRNPFAAIYTSLGCTFRCSFCMINMINRNSNHESLSASDFNKMRFFSAKWLEKEFDWLKAQGVKTLRISDEMFYLNRAHYKPILDLLTEKKYDFNMWAYSRVDTIRKEFIPEFKNAGINWLALGIEAGADSVRSGSFKGKFLSEQVVDNVKALQSGGIKVLANFIVGLPSDTKDTINETLELALGLNPEYVNFYPCMALPGSELHLQATKSGQIMPDSYEGYAFLSYECVPMQTDTLSAQDVLQLRDEVFERFVTDPKYKKLFLSTFGNKAMLVLEDMIKIKLKRRLLEIN